MAARDRSAWLDALTVIAFIAGAVVAGIFGQGQLAGVLAGAAAGMVARAPSPRSSAALPVVLALAGGGVGWWLTTSPGGLL